MSESIQVMPSASSGAQQSKPSTLAAGNNPESTDDPSGFTAVFASYIESEPTASDQQLAQNMAELLSEMLPQDMLPQNMLNDGNMLPEDDTVAMWQALMMIQPAETLSINTPAAASQSISLLDSSRKPVLTPQLMTQDYFQTTAMPSKDAAPVMQGLANNLSTQLAAAHFTPDSNETLVLNLNDQLVPVQGTNSSLSQGLAATGFGTVTQAATSQTQMAPLNLGQNAWESNLGSRLQMMVSQNIQSAEIRLDPPELGALDIKIKVANDVATVNITSAHTQVKEALETAVPRLREMFEESGLALGDVNVRQESFSQQEQFAEDAGSEIFSEVENEEAGDQQSSEPRKIVSNNLLDMYV